MKNFPGQQTGEKVELCTNLHCITLVPHVFIFILGIVALIIINLTWLQFSWNQTSGLFAIFVDGMALSILFHYIYIKILNYYLNGIIVTNFRIIDFHCTTLLHRRRRNIDFINIQDIEVSQNKILERIFDYGKITIHNSAGEEIFIFYFLPKAQKNYNLINHIHRKVVENIQKNK